MKMQRTWRLPKNVATVDHENLSQGLMRSMFMEAAGDRYFDDEGNEPRTVADRVVLRSKWRKAAKRDGLIFSAERRPGRLLITSALKEETIK